MKKLITLSVLFISSNIFAGNGGGTGTPPALQDEMALLMSSDRDMLSLFNNSDTPVLLSRSELLSQLSITSDSLTSSSDPSLLLKVKSIDAIQVGTDKTRSYDIKSGDKLGAFDLIDRRAVMRNSVKYPLVAE